MYYIEIDMYGDEIDVEKTIEQQVICNYKT